MEEKEILNLESFEDFMFYIIRRGVSVYFDRCSEDHYMMIRFKYVNISGDVFDYKCIMDFRTIETCLLDMLKWSLIKFHKDIMFRANNL